MEESNKQPKAPPPSETDLVADLLALESDLLLGDFEALDALAALEAELIGGEMPAFDTPISVEAAPMPDEALLLAEIMAMEEMGFLEVETPAVAIDDALLMEALLSEEAMPAPPEEAMPAPVVEVVPEVVAPVPVVEPEPPIVEPLAEVVEPETAVVESVEMPAFPEKVTPEKVEIDEEENEWAKMPATSGILDDWVAEIDQRYVQNKATISVKQTRPENQEQMIIFTMGNTRYAVPIHNIVEIGQADRVTQLPNVPAWLKGITNLRGDILSLVDLGDFMGLNGNSNHNPHQQMLVAKSQQQTMTTGLLVDKVNEIRHLSLDQLPDTPPQLGKTAPPFLRGIYQQDEQLLLLLDLEKMLQSPELQQFI